MSDVGEREVVAFRGIELRQFPRVPTVPTSCNAGGVNDDEALLFRKRLVAGEDRLVGTVRSETVPVEDNGRRVVGDVRRNEDPDVVHGAAGVERDVGDPLRQRIARSAHLRRAVDHEARVGRVRLRRRRTSLAPALPLPTRVGGNGFGLGGRVDGDVGRRCCGDRGVRRCAVSVVTVASVPPALSLPEQLATTRATGIRTVRSSPPHHRRSGAKPLGPGARSSPGQSRVTAAATAAHAAPAAATTPTASRLLTPLRWGATAAGEAARTNSAASASVGGGSGRPAGTVVCVRYHTGSVARRRRCWAC